MSSFQARRDYRQDARVLSKAALNLLLSWTCCRGVGVVQISPKDRARAAEAAKDKDGKTPVNTPFSVDRPRVNDGFA